MNFTSDPFTWNSDDPLPPWLSQPQPVYSRELAHVGFYDEPIILCKGTPWAAPFGVTYALALFERYAAEVLG